LNKQNDDKGERECFISWLEGHKWKIWHGFWLAAFTSLFLYRLVKGQTPGKNTIGNQVIKLDGKSLTYGKLWALRGLGAGFATGFACFLQVYWDPNRQAIQTKYLKHFVIGFAGGRKSDFVAESAPPCSKLNKLLANQLDSCWAHWQLSKDSQTMDTGHHYQYSRPSIESRSHE